MSLPHHCRLCPRACGADRAAGQTGYCGADDRLMVARAALHHWEEPCLSGAPDDTRGSGTVFFSGCALRCCYCQNWRISAENFGRDISVPHLADIFLRLQAQGAHNINLVTASHYAPSVCRALRMARRDGLRIPVVYNCGGYETVETLRLLDGLVDIYLPDFKYYSTYYAGLYSGAPDYPDVAREALTEMVRQTGAPQFDAAGLMTRGTVVRHLMLPGLAGDTAQVLRYLAEHFGDRILVSLMRQYTPFGMEAYPELDRKITDSEYEDAVHLFSDLGLAGFLQDGESISESFIPAFDGQGV